MKRAIATILLLILLSCFMSSCSSKEEPTEPEPMQSDNNLGYVERTDLETILLIGIDKFSEDIDYSGYRNNYQSDFLMLIVIDTDDNTCRALQLNRDTMTNVKILGVAGDEAGYRFEQLALSHTYGSGGSDSAINTCQAVSDLLYGVKINHYIQTTMDAVALVNDYLGGVTVEVMDDLTQFDAELVKGSTVTLHGAQALIYVRQRYDLEDNTNLHRMERQQQYLQALGQVLRQRIQANDNFVDSMLLDVLSSIETDCSLNKLSELIQKVDLFEPLEILTIDGENVVGEATDITPEFMEFYINEEDLKQKVLSLFYEKTA
ncbi:MAG: LCP family protein [Oscillospiraceae bacterium]|nr:LCP family protein [Oscillospiraceae bacterium]